MKSYILCDVLQASFVSSRGFSGFVKNPAAASNSLRVSLMTKMLLSLFADSTEYIPESS